MQGIKRSLDKIQMRLRKQGETVAVIESVTAGNLQAALSLAENATDFFQGGMTLYNLGQKAKHLDIDPILAQQINCVADWIASSMATEACRLFSSTWGIAITGYAAPVPEWNVKNVFHAWFAIAHQGRVLRVSKLVIKRTEIEKVQRSYVKSVLAEFSTVISSRKP